MITFPNGVNIRDPIEIESLSARNFIKVQDYQETRPFDFVLPEHVQNMDNHQKTIYKSGFLFEVYKFLFPEKRQDQIIEILVNRYHIFVGLRQFHRNLKSYNTEKYSIFVQK